MKNTELEFELQEIIELGFRDPDEFELQEIIELGFRREIIELGFREELDRRQRLAEVYRIALSEGAAEVSYCRVMLLGPAGVGKTCLRRGLMGLSFDPSTNSTIVADVHSVRPMSREWMTPADRYVWDEVTEQDEIMELAQLMVLAGADKKLLIDIHFGTTTTSDPVSEYSTVGSSCSLDKLRNLMESDIVRKAIGEAQQLQKLSTIDKIKCHPFFHLWDCGGQPVFLEVLPLFLTSRTLFLILFNASTNLEEPWESFYHMDGKRYHADEKANTTTLQMMERWIAMIYSHLLKKDEHGVDPGYPRVIPIGTRKDQLKSDRGPQQVIKVIDDAIHGKAFHQVVEKPIIIDNTTSGSSDGEDEGYKVIREKVFDMAMSKLRKVNTPIAWILFRKLLQLLSKTSPNANIISLQEVCAIASIAKIKPGDVKEVLRFYHDLGVFLYYPNIEGLKEKVILDPKWFVECLGKVLSLDPHFTDEKYEDRNEWKLFRSKGIIVEPLLYKTCQGIEPKEFIELLTHFLLAVKVETDQYFDKSKEQFFIPAILPYYPVQSALSSPPKIKVAAPLHVTFDSGFVVPGFFTRLSVTTLKESNDPEIPFKFDLYFGDDDDKSEIYHNRVTYEMSTKRSLRQIAPLFVTVSEEISCIAVDVNSYSHVSPQKITEIQNSCLNLKSHMKACSEYVSLCLQSLHSNITESISSPQVKVVCRAKAQCQRKGIHYLNPPSHEGLSIDDCMVTCERNRRIPRKITIEEAYWFKVQINSANIPSSKDLGTSTSRSLENAMPPHNSQDTDLEKKKEIRQLNDSLLEVERKLLGDKTMELSQEDLQVTSKLKNQLVTRERNEYEPPTKRTKEEPINSASIPSSKEAYDSLEDASTYNQANTAIKSELKKVDDPVTTDTTSLTASPPTVDEVYSLLEGKASNWNGIGRALKVSHDYRETLRKDISLSDEDRLENVLSKWSESHCSPVSWNNIKTVLEKLQYMHLVPEVEKKCL